jgi:hypothetical protein
MSPQEIAIVSSHRQGARLEDVVFKPNDKKLILAVPDAVLEDCERIGVDTSFFAGNAAPSYYGFEDLREIESATKINGLAEMITVSTISVCAQFISAFQKAAQSGGKAPSNGSKFGVSTIDKVEGAGLNIGLHETNYLTSTIFGNVYKGLRAISHPSVADNRLSYMPHPNEDNYAVLFGTLGLNTSVLIQGDAGEGAQYLFGVRKNGDLHVAMNKGLYPFESVSGLESFTLKALYEHGMEDELGLKNLDSVHATQPIVRETFLVKGSGQFGIHVVTELDMTLDELKGHHATAKGFDENQAFVRVPFNHHGLYPALQQETKIVPYTRDLIKCITLDLDA